MVQKLLFLVFGLGICLFLGLTTFVNLFAEGAGMLSVEGLDECAGEGFLACVVHEHIGPGNSLQNRPMGTCCAHKSNNEKNMTNTPKHWVLYAPGRAQSQE